MLPPHLALVSQSEFVDRGLLMKVSAAVQKQMTRDVARFWDISATVDPFDRLSDVPTDYWPIVVRNDIGLPGVRGIHWTKDNQPFALVQASTNADRVSHAVSHEAVEMVLDPSGSRLVAGASLVPDQGRVNYLVEPCDPTQEPDPNYRVNGILVCDFCTPRYFDPLATPGVAYSQSGRVTRPREVIQGGYLSWIVPATDHLWQAVNFDGELEIHDRGPYDPNIPIRFQTDRAIQLPWRLAADESNVLSRTSEVFSNRAGRFEKQIEGIISDARAKSTAPGPAVERHSRSRKRRKPR